MKRPSFQFYPADWRSNTNLRRCSLAARGAWVDVMCVLHDSDEYGVIRWPLDELAAVANVPIEAVRELVAKNVLKGSESTVAEFSHTTRHAGKDGETHVLIPAGVGPCWFSSRMVVDEFRRNASGGETRFGSPSRTPSQRQGERQGETPSGQPSQRQGHGATSSSSSPSSSPSPATQTKQAASPLVLPFQSAGFRTAWENFTRHRVEKKAKMTPTAEKLALQKLAAMGESRAVQALEHSTANGWTGVFEPTVNGKPFPQSAPRERKLANLP